MSPFMSVVICLAILTAGPVSAQRWSQADMAASNQITKLVAEAQAAEARHDDATAAARYEAVLERTKAHPALGSGLQMVGLNGLMAAEARLGNSARQAEIGEM